MALGLSISLPTSVTMAPPLHTIQTELWKKQFNLVCSYDSSFLLSASMDWNHPGVPLGKSVRRKKSTWNVGGGHPWAWVPEWIGRVPASPLSCFPTEHGRTSCLRPLPSCFHPHSGPTLKVGAKTHSFICKLISSCILSEQWKRSLKQLNFPDQMAFHCLHGVSHPGLQYTLHVALP